MTIRFGAASVVVSRLEGNSWVEVMGPLARPVSVATKKLAHFERKSRGGKSACFTRAVIGGKAAWN
ncbi:MAG TPA: hypothetical protein DEB25_06735 [Desulfobulbaceae bacterium]|nr:hypothetical protein [Desulfobulbaceae bacterium]